MTAIRPPADRAAARRGLAAGRGFEAVTAAAYLLGIAVLVGAILWLNQGRFTYSLDDPYIHLAVAENVAAGHYGLNPGETSSPVSSVIWPLVLAPFASLEHFDKTPLLLDTGFMLATLWVFAGAVRKRLVPELSTAAQAAIVLLVALCCNFWGMPLNGMEHSAQLLLTLWVALGVIEVVETGRAPWTMVAGLVLGPLVRFENYALVLPAAWVMAARRERGKAIFAVAASVACAAAYMAFFRHQGLPLLPASVLAKSDLVASDSAWRALAEITENLGESLFKSRIQVALVLLYLLWRRRGRDGARRPADDLAYFVFLAGVVGTHMLAGRYDWYGRYEIYLMVAVATVSLFVFRESLATLIASRRRVLVPILVLLALYVGKNQIHATFTTPLSANNIYEMQYQMHRFAVDYWRDAVAVNDIGWVSFRNPHYVLDLWGVNSARARRLRQHAQGNAWAEELAAEHEIDLLMLFAPWFTSRGELPASWEPAAELRISRRPVQVPMRTISFFSRNPARRDELARRLAEFGATLPPAVELEVSAPTEAAEPVPQANPTRVEDDPTGDGGANPGAYRGALAGSVLLDLQ